MKREKLLIYLYSFLTCLSLSFLDIIPSYSFISLLFFIILIYFYKNNICKFKDKKILFILSVILSLLFPLGKVLSDNYDNIIFSLFNIRAVAKILICMIGLIPFFSFIINYLFAKFNKININKDNKISIKYWFVFSLIIFILWIPYFFINYPGIISSDVVDQLNQFLGYNMLNDHHPVFHTIYIGLLYKIFSFSSSNFAVSLTVVTQMIILALIFGYLVYYLNKKGLNKIWTIIIIIFYASPIFGIYSVNLWKDTIFSATVLLFIISIMNICDNYNKSNYVLFIISSILCLLFRNNAIYMYILFIPVSLILLKNKLKNLVICFGIILLSYFIIKGPVYKYYNIGSGSSAEYLAIPIQQISRVVSKDIKLDKKDEKLINNVINIKVIKEVYKPYTSDYVKFNENFNVSAYDQNKISYLKLWTKLCVKHPFVMTESYLLSTIGYWYPDTYNYMEYDVIADNDLGIYYDSKMPSYITNIFNGLKNRHIPILSLEYSSCFGLYLILISLILCYYKNNKKYSLCYMPVIFLWLTILIATPVASEFRYIFWSYTCLPILLFIPFKKEK